MNSHRTRQTAHPRTVNSVTRAARAALLLGGAALLLSSLVSCTQQAYQKDTNSTNYNYQYNK